MLEVIGFHFYCICAEVTPPEGWSRLGLSRFALIYTAHKAESSRKIVRNSNTIKHEKYEILAVKYFLPYRVKILQIVSVVFTVWDK